MFDTGEDCWLVSKYLPGFQVKYQSGTAFGARMLREQQHTDLRALSGGTITEPCCQRNTRNIFRGYTAQVQHNGTEAASL
jgi:hypothetical protein